MEYIVLDLEWNQSNTGTEPEVGRLPFEIIEIGAIKLNDRGVMLGEFSELIRPTVYRQMHHITSKLIHMQIQELERGKPFGQVAEKFLAWCGEDYTFCTWGNSDLTELQRNLQFYNMTPLSDRPMPYLDVQKLFSLAYEDGKSRRSLEYAVDFLRLEKDIPFHRAFSDAYYTARVFDNILEDAPQVLQMVSYDVFHVPPDRDAEVKVQFDTYAKYISRAFEDKNAAMHDREVSSSKCYLCHRNLHKKIRWFTPNGKNYYCLAFCDKHGYLKGKIRMRKTDDDKVFVVKTTKLISEEAADELAVRKKHAAEQHKRHRENEIKNRRNRNRKRNSEQ
ncbi:MAG: exonuclease domain-containing protein [Lachnospiraceae bacterium]|nr:exonuclease domain-containing protein [Lachnospiraceae bacterium]